MIFETNNDYLQFMYERLILLKELLANDGNIYIHCDYSIGYYAYEIILDEVFGGEKVCKRNYLAKIKSIKITKFKI